MAAALVEACVKWLSVYVYCIVPLLTLLMHLILAIFSDSRRREGRGWKRVLVWVAYQLTDWSTIRSASDPFPHLGPTYVIGNLYLETSPSEKMMVAFWVPFLLLHHGRPDNIGAYAIEDAKLWLRLLVLDIPLSVGSFFVVYRYILAECIAGLYLRWASGIMLPLDILKHLENTLALWRSELGHIRNRGDQEKLSELDDEKALLVAHDLFEICKGAFCDYPWGSMCKVVEMELSLMYDILYTKAAVVHTWHGYAIRLASPPLTAIALLLFGLHCKESMPTEDEVISYVLLCMTLLLDVRWLFRALASGWTYSYFERMPCNWLKHEFWCQGRCVFPNPPCGCGHVHVRPKEPKSYRRWSGIFGQCNLLSQCTAGNRHNLYSIPRLAIEWEGHSSLRDFQLEDHSRGLEIPDSVKKLGFQNIWEKLFRDPVELAKRERQSNTDDSPPRPPNHDKRCPSCGELPDYCTCHPTSTNPVKGCFDVSSDPDYCTCVHPGSLDPGGHCLGILYGPPGTPYPRERICNGIDDEPALCPQYPREWCKSIWEAVEDQAAPWLQYPRERICISVNNEPPRLPYPWQVCAGIRNAPFEENEYNVQARPHHHPDEQAAEYDRAPPEPYEQANILRHVHTSSSYARIPLDTKRKGQSDEGQPDKDMGFPPKLQEAILIWHIATNVFLSYSSSSSPSPRITGEESKEQAKVIEQMSDYMMFLVANRPEMLPGLTVRYPVLY
ncbi:hypothetical protein VPH35_004829 [Triticum aestivum]